MYSSSGITPIKSIDNLFISIQTFNSKFDEIFKVLPPDYYDYIVIADRNTETIDMAPFFDEDLMSVTINNIVACLFDRDALGTYKTDEWSATTPVNAAGGYYNVFYHERDIWFNDLAENFVMFYIGTVTK